jgi:hypothetical protein
VYKLLQTYLSGLASVTRPCSGTRVKVGCPEEYLRMHTLLMSECVLIDNIYEFWWKAEEDAVLIVGLSESCNTVRFNKPLSFADGAG